MRPVVEHPTLGVPSPTLPQLVEASTEEARALWAAAGALASVRIQGQDELRRAYASLYEAPSDWARPAPALPLPGGDFLEPNDLARALVVRHPELLEPLAGPALTEAAGRWADRMGPPTELTLSPIWARRWCYLWSGDGGVIDVPRLVRGLPWRSWHALAALDSRVVEGTIAHSEAVDRLLDGLARQGQGLVGPVPPPAYLQRVDDEHLRSWLDAPLGALVVGPAGSGKRTSIGRIGRLRSERPIHVDNFHGAGPPDPAYRATPQVVPATVNPGQICVWSSHGLGDPESRATPSRYNSLGPSPSAAGLPELLRYAVELALDEPADFRLVLLLTEEQRARCCAWAPDLEKWPVHRLEAPTDEELLPLWLCQRPLVEDMLGDSCALFDLLARVGSGSLRERLLQVQPAGRWLWVPDPAGPLANALRGAPCTSVRVGPGFRQQLARRPEKAWLRLMRQAPDLQALVSGPEQLVWLAELDAALSGALSSP
ncbi:MAG: hypothetical protein KTR31_41705 [Myxococcales bacterium]|nr:hypothetical protein [Myxococcales bacterium]